MIIFIYSLNYLFTIGLLNILTSLIDNHCKYSLSKDIKIKFKKKMNQRSKHNNLFKII